MRILFHSISMFSKCDMHKCFRVCGKCTKVLFVTSGRAAFRANVDSSNACHELQGNTPKTGLGHLNPGLSSILVGCSKILVDTDCECRRDLQCGNTPE